jgi:hypothetical protein
MAESPRARLRALADRPAERFALALQIVEKERNAEVVITALKVLQDAEDERARPALLARYEAVDRDGARRDPGGAVRVAVLRALQMVAWPDDAALFARAASTYEFRFGEVAGDLRAAGLLALSGVDTHLAGFHAVRLLHDAHTSPMSGEPAVTAARVLAGIGQPLPLYACVVREIARPPEREPDVPGEVLGECLRGLTSMPATLVPALVTRFRESRDEVILLGLFDLLLEHPARAEFAPTVREFLRTTALLDLYRSLVATLIAGRDPEWQDELHRMAREERHPGKAAVLHEALPARGRN